MGGIAFYINGLLPSRIIKIQNISYIKILTIEITIRKPPNLTETDFTASFKTFVSKLSSKYEKLILIEDFNMTTSNEALQRFS